ncbi:MAG: type II secretion system protein [Candidatus Hydrogenedentota bacterium]
MNTRRAGVRGFTLIELLTVIAIIGILASLTAAVLPRVLAKAKVTGQRANFKAIETALATYSVDNGGSFPPRYGYIVDPAFQYTIETNYPNIPGGPDANENSFDFVVEPYTVPLKIVQMADLQDKFAADGIDSDGDGLLQLLEYEPIGFPKGPSSFGFDFCLYTGPATCPQEEDRQRRATGRFPVYIPVNGQQFDRFAQFLYNQNATDPRPRDTDVNISDPGWQSMMLLRFPPNKYDRFVLVGSSPDGGVFGMLDVLPQRYRDVLSPYYRYHWEAMAAYFMATRDADGDGYLDFDYTARTQHDAGKPEANNLPELERRRGGGPLIFKSQ